jgi:hypothetical protein
MRLYELPRGNADQTFERQIFDLRIANPLYEPDVPIWHAESLPVVKSNGPFTVALNELRCRWELPADARETGGASRLVMEPEFALEVANNSGEAANVDWRWNDPAGNSSREALSPFGSCLKLAVSVRRKPEATFTVDETWTLDPIPMEQFRGHQDFNLRRTIEGVDVVMAQIIGPGIIRDGHGQFHQAPPVHDKLPILMGAGGFPSRDFQLPCFSIHVSSAAPTDICPFVRDQLGRLLNQIEQVHIEAVQKDTFRVVSFEPKPDSTSAQLTISLNRPRKFEFYVEPPEEARELVRKAAAAGRASQGKE